MKITRMTPNPVRILLPIIWISFILPLSSLFAQSTYTFEKTIGGISVDQANYASLTPDSGYIITGSTFSFTAGSFDVLLVKLDRFGNQQWSRRFGNNFVDEGRCVRPTADGGFIIAGYTSSYGTGSYDIFLIKTDASGNLQWAKTFGGASNEFGYSVSENADSGFVVTGVTASAGSGGFDLYAIRTDKNGNLIWSKAVGGPSNDYGFYCRQTPDGGFVFTGKSTSFTAGSEDVYVVKLTAGGTLDWAHRYGSTSTDNSNTIEPLQNGGLMITGSTSSYGSGSSDLLLIHTDGNGIPVWSRTYGGGSPEVGYASRELPDSSFITLGYTQSYGNGGNDFFIARTDKNGVPISTWTRGGASNDFGFSAYRHEKNGFVLAGYTESYGAGSSDFFILRYDSTFSGGCRPDTASASSTTFNITHASINPNVTNVVFNTSPTPVNAAVSPTQNTLCLSPSCDIAATFTATDTMICTGDSVTLINNTPYSIQVEWLENGASISNANGITRTYTTAGTYDIRLVANDGLCVDTSAIFTITVDTIPVISLGADSTNCAGDSVQLDAGAGYSYFWSTSQTSQSIFATSTGAYHVQVTDGNGCIGRDTINIEIATQFASLPNDTTICTGDSMRISPGSSFSAYSWSTTASSDSITINTTGTFWVNVTDSYGCISSDTIDLIIDFPPAIFLGNDTSFCAGDSILLDAGAGFVTYGWNSVINGQSIYADTSGTYIVIGTDTAGCTSTDTINLTRVPLPAPNIGADTSICQGDTLDLFAGLGFAAYLWNTGATSANIPADTAGLYWVEVTNVTGCTGRDSMVLAVNPLPALNLGNDTISCGGNPVPLDAGAGFVNYTWSTGDNTQSITASTDGTYSVTITDGNACSVSDTINIIIAPAINVNLGADTSICSGDSVALSAPAGFPAYSWTTGETTNSIIANSTGNYGVVVTDAFGCQDGDTVALTVNTLPVINLGNDTSACNGNPVMLDAGAGFAGYLWSDGGTGQSSNAASSGIYYVTVTDGNGCIGSDTVVVTISAPLALNLGADTTICSGDSVILNAGAGFSSYNWNTGSTATGITVSTSGNYHVTVTDANNCSASDSIQVTVNPIPNVFLGNDTILCSGNIIQLNAGFGYAQYQWSHGPTSQIVNITTGGTYFVNVTDSAGCQGMSNLINVTVAPSPAQPTITESNGQLISSTAPAYQWSADGVMINGANAQTYEPTVTGMYTVTITDANGCTATSLPVEIILDLTVEDLPNAISPNGDGINDEFIIPNIRAFPDNELVIFNRWGDIILETVGYDNSWNGVNRQGEPLPAGTYYFAFRYKLGAAPLKGTILIYR